MSSRKFYFLFSSGVCFVLFLLGSSLLFGVNLNQIFNKNIYKSSVIGKIMSPLVNKPQVFNVLILGGDKVNKNSDTILVANINLSTNNVNIISIPRDTRIKINGQPQKINAAYPHGGSDFAVKTISSLLNTDIKYYVFFDTSAFKKTIDILGGVDFYVPENMDYDDPIQNLHIHLRKGQQILTGAKAEQIMRYRQSNSGIITKNYNGSDLNRISVQQTFIKEFIRQKADIRYVPKLKSVLDVCLKNVETNLSMQEILSLTEKMAQIKSDSINTFMLPGYPIEESPWYYICDRKETRNIIGQYFSLNN